MNRKQATTGVAVLGVVAGAAGLTVMAIPAGAGPAPSLPKTTPEALVSSVLSAKPAAFGGTVSAHSNLGFPVPGMSPNSSGDYEAKVYADGNGDSRVTMRQSSQAQSTLVHSGDTAWTYDSAKRAATKTTIPAGAKQRMHHAEQAPKDPATMARDVLATVRKSSTVAVDGTAEVAGRSAYELVLTPKPSEKTLVREVRVAVDAQTKTPLRFEMFGNGTSEPAVELGFDQIDVGKQDPGLFRFTPPEGTKVTTIDPGKHMQQQGRHQQADTRAVGDGWDTVLTGSMPEGALTQGGGQRDRRGPERGQNVNQLLDRFSKPVSGKFGTGRLVNTPIGTAVLTSDGRYAAGLVPEQVVEQALGTR